MMKATGIVRNVDPLGRIVIPKELRRTMVIDEGTPLEIFVNEDKIVLRKYEPACTFCGSADGTVNYKGKIVCKSCMNDLSFAGKRVG